MLFHHPLDVLNDHDGVVDHDADREHDGEQGYRIGGIADRLERDERADQAHRHRQRRNQGGADVAEEQEDHQHNENEGFEKRLLHFVHGIFDENRRIIWDRPGQIVGKTLFQLGKLFPHGVYGIDRIAAGRLVDHHRCGVVAVEPRVAVEIGGAQFELCDVAQSQNRAVRICANDDVLEVLDRARAVPWSGC